MVEETVRKKNGVLQNLLQLKLWWRPTPVLPHRVIHGRLSLMLSRVRLNKGRAFNHSVPRSPPRRIELFHRNIAKAEPRRDPPPILRPSASFRPQYP